MENKINKDENVHRYLVRVGKDRERGRGGEKRKRVIETEKRQIYDRQTESYSVRGEKRERFTVRGKKRERFSN